MTEKKGNLAAGVYAALATPCRPGTADVDTAALLEYLDNIVAAGVQGLVLFGSTGEWPQFEMPERTRAASLAIKRSRVPVLVNVSHPSLAGAIAIAEHAIDAGAAGLLLTPPYFYRYPDEQIFEFFQRFLDEVGTETPIYLYHLPQYVNGFSPELAERLLASNAFSGIKDSSGDPSFFEKLAALRRQYSFQLIAGNEATYVRARTAGADGVISGVAGALPELMVALDGAITARDDARTAEWSKRLAEFVAHINQFPGPLAVRQAALVRGWSFQQLAVPLDEDSAAEVIAFHAWLRTWLSDWLPSWQKGSRAAGEGT